MMRKAKNYTSAPLPFMGQKRRFLKEFKEALKQYPATATYVDLFGGSGLLSHTLKAVYPEAVIVYNDYDRYSERIKAIPKTNDILRDLRAILQDWPKDKRITGDVREAVLMRLERETGYVDYITLSSSLCFSMNYAQSLDEMKSSSLYNCVRQSDYNADGYLEGVNVVSCDYKRLFAEYKGRENVIFVVDPPYLSTETGTYKNYWKLTDYLDVLDVLNGTSYFYFTSNKSSILELCEWVETKTGGENPFVGAYKSEVNVSMNYQASYTDIMLHKKGCFTSSSTDISGRTLQYINVQNTNECGK